MEEYKKSDRPIYWKSYKGKDLFSERLVEFEGWSHVRTAGIFDSYVSALADYIGLWEEYCEYHRNGFIK